MPSKIQSIAIDQIHIDPANVRRHPERNLAAIKASLARFGQQRPIVVDAKGIVRAGNGTLEAAKALGWEKIDIVRTGLQGSEATAFAIADNRSAELAEWDDSGLAATLQALQAEDFDLSAIGFTAAEVDELVASLGGINGEVVDDPDGEWQGMPEFDNPANAFQTIHVHFKAEDDVKDFAERVGRPIDRDTKTLWFPLQPIAKPDKRAWVSIE